MKKEKIKREKIKLDNSFVQTDYGPWDYKGETYIKVDDIQRHGDGQEHDTIVKRKSDGKFFKFSWCYFPDSCGEPYEFDTNMTEVFPKTTTKYE